MTWFTHRVSPYHFRPSWRLHELRLNGQQNSFWPCPSNIGGKNLFSIPVGCWTQRCRLGRRIGQRSWPAFGTWLHPTSLLSGTAQSWQANPRLFWSCKPRSALWSAQRVLCRDSRRFESTQTASRNHFYHRQYCRHFQPFLWTVSSDLWFLTLFSRRTSPRISCPAIGARPAAAGIARSHCPAPRVG